MGIDRFVNWKKKKKGPSLAAVRAVLRDYLGSGSAISISGARITAVIQGKPSYPFRSIAAYKKYTEAVEVHPVRWFEVFVTEKNIDIITRQADEYTNVVAEGFSKLAARLWDGELEDH